MALTPEQLAEARIIIAQEEAEKNQKLTEEIRENFRKGNLKRDLIKACRKGQPRKIKSLLSEDGAEVNAAFYDWTLIIHSIISNQPKSIKALIEAGADIEMEWKGETPLIVATLEACDEIVEILIEAGVNLTAKGAKCPKTALELAKENGHHEIVSILEKAMMTQDPNFKGTVKAEEKEKDWI